MTVTGHMFGVCVCVCVCVCVFQLWSMWSCGPSTVSVSRPSWWELVSSNTPSTWTSSRGDEQGTNCQSHRFKSQQRSSECPDQTVLVLSRFKVQISVLHPECSFSEGQCLMWLLDSSVWPHQVILTQSLKEQFTHYCKVKCGSPQNSSGASQ